MGELAFRLRLVEASDTWVIVCDTPYGETVRRIPAAYTSDELRVALAEINLALVRAASPVISRRASPDRAPREMGDRLSEAVLGGDVRALFDRCRSKARERNDTLQVMIDTDGPSVSRIPWELMTDPAASDDYLALRLPVVRSPHLLNPPSPRSIKPPLRVLCVMAQPKNLPSLDVASERTQVSVALERMSSELVRVEWLGGDRWRDLSAAVRFRPWHVLHFIGHGGFDEDIGTGYIELSDEHGNAMRISGTDLGRLIASNPELRLVLLNACETAATGAAGVFSSTAAKLMREGVPAVVAMQYEISDPAAIAFACSFYDALAHDVPVDRAVTFARESVKVTLQSLEWATPVLFLASDQTQIFTMPQHGRAGITEAGAASTTGGAAGQDSPLTDEATHPVRPRPRPADDAAAAGSRPTSPTAGPATPGVRPATPRPVPEPAPDGGDWIAATRQRLSEALQRWTSTTGARPPEEATTPTLSSRSPQTQVDESPPVAQAASRHGSPAAASSFADPRLLAQHVRRVAEMGPSAHAAVGPGGAVAVAGRDGVVRVVAASAGRLLGQCALPRRERPARVAWSPWRRTLASIHDGGLAVVWNVQTEVPVRVQRLPGRVEALAFSASGRWLAAAADRAVRIFDPQGREVRQLPLVRLTDSIAAATGHWGTVHDLVFADGDRALVVATDDGGVRRFDAAGRLAGVWQHPGAVLCVRGADTVLVTVCADGRVSLWSWDERLIHRWEIGTRAEHAAISQDGERIAVVAGDRMLRVWGRDGSWVGAATLPTRPVGVGFLPGGEILTAVESGALDVWTTT